MRLTKEDKKYLIFVLGEHHQKINQLTVKECPFDDCWYKKMIEILKKRRKKNAKK